MSHTDTGSPDRVGLCEAGRAWRLRSAWGGERLLLTRNIIREIDCQLVGLDARQSCVSKDSLDLQKSGPIWQALGP